MRTAPREGLKEVIPFPNRFQLKHRRGSSRKMCPLGTKYLSSTVPKHDRLLKFFCCPLMRVSYFPVHMSSDAVL